MSLKFRFLAWFSRVLVSAATENSRRANEIKRKVIAQQSDLFDKFYRTARDETTRAFDDAGATYDRAMDMYDEAEAIARSEVARMDEFRAKLYK